MTERTILDVLNDTNPRNGCSGLPLTLGECNLVTQMVQMNPQVLADWLVEQATYEHTSHNDAVLLALLRGLILRK